VFCSIEDDNVEIEELEVDISELDSVADPELADPANHAAFEAPDGKLS
jgi:hypothetical protein